MRVTLSPRLALISVISVCLFGAARVETARRPRYGGTLRVEIGAAVNSVDPATAPGNAEEAAAKEQIDALIYDRRNLDGTFTGAGPFRIAEWDPGKHLTLSANEDYSQGRPFIDSIEIQMARNAHDRLLDLELGKADFAGIPPDQTRRAADAGIRTSASQPDELIALVFVSVRPAAENARVREALACSLDRAAMVNFILQKAGEPAGGLLPQWSSGTAFLFSTASDVAHSKELWSQIGSSRSLVLGYDSGDSLDQSLADRIVVNARDAGIIVTAKEMSAAKPVALTASAAANPGVDVRLVHWRMPSPFPRTALSQMLGKIGAVSGIDAGSLPDAATPEQIYELERTIVGGFRIIPLVWVPQIYGLSARVKDWKPPAPGETWPLADVWIDAPTVSTGVQ